MMKKGRIEFDDPTFKEHPSKGISPLTIDQKREQVRRGNPELVRYGGVSPNLLRQRLEFLESDNERLNRRIAVLEEELDNAREIVAGWLIGVEYPESLAIFDVLDKALAESKRIAEEKE